MISNEFTTAGRFLTSASELAKFAGLSGSGGKGNFFLLSRRDVENPVEMGNQVEFPASKLGYRQARRT